MDEPWATGRGSCAAPSGRARILRWLEMLALFAGAPLLIYFEVLPGWKIPWLALFAAVLGLWLALDPGFDNRRFYRAMPARPYLRVMLLRAVLVGAVILVLVLALMPEDLFSFPRSKPRVWAVVMLLYPLLSAYPQEIAYKAFFFNRYACLFRSRQVLLVCNATAFAFLHVIYDNPLAVVLTLPIGWLMARTYALTGSLLLVSLEHGLYGCLSFTLGLGRFFYEGR